MASAAVRTYLTPEEYLAFERKATTKHEYLNGQIVAMSGASREHNLITGNMFNGLYTQLIDRACETYVSEMRVKNHQTDSYTYPDIVVVCDEPRFEDDGCFLIRCLIRLCLLKCFRHLPRRMTGAKNSHTIDKLPLCKNTSSFHRIGLAWSTIFGKAHSGSSLNFAGFRRYCLSFQLDANSICRIFIDASHFLRSPPL